ncbi:glycosyltransferase family 2 protein [Planctomycetota bacterium]
MRDENSLLVSIVIPCRNEEKFIGKCLDSIIDNHFPQDRLEVLVVDGMSEDGTKEVVSEYARKNSFIKRLVNSERITPTAMNIGIKSAKGDIIILVNAHSILDKEFLKYSVEYLDKTKADAIGGALRTINDVNSLIARAIPLAVDSALGAGGRRYRNRTEEGWIRDTLPYCAYRKEIFEKLGFIDEELVRAQDAEFNYRILRSGGRIYYSPKIKSYLHIRPTLGKLWRQHYQYGCHKPLVIRKAGVGLMWRQSVPGLFVGSMLISLVISIIFRPFIWLLVSILGVYAIAVLGSSLMISINNGIKYFLVLPFIFATLHFSYGIGYLKGLLGLIVSRRNQGRQIKDLPLSR